MQLSSYQILASALTFVGIAVQAALVVLLARKKQRTNFPIFFAYNAFCAVAGVALLIGYYAASLGVFNQYFWEYWVLNTGVILFEFAIMYEVFVTAVKPYSGLIDLAKFLFRWAILFMFVTAALTAVANGGSAIDKCVAMSTYVERGLRLVQCGFLLLFLLFERRLGLSWRNHSISAALALGGYAAITLTLTYLRTAFPNHLTAFSLVDQASYAIMISGWLIAFSLPQPAAKSVLESPSKLIFQRWNEVLMATPFVSTPTLAMASNNMDSFLPSVERTVERVMARKMVN